MMLAVALALALNLPLDEPAPVRLVATGTGVALVEWRVDGRAVATTADGEAARVELGPGEHAIVARTTHRGPWEALARPDPAGEGLAFVPAATAAAEPVPRGWRGEAAAAVLAAASVALRLPKRP